jgi:cyclopropane fatty-acyl-phospholipid synthase-like methyltransferase
MAQKISPRLAEIVEALPLRLGMRVLEIGCGSGVVARAVLERIGAGQVLAIDCSAKAIAQAKAGSRAELATGQLEFRRVAIEDLVLDEGEKPYDLAFAVRVGSLDGRHPEAAELALERTHNALVKGGRLFIDGGNPLMEVTLGVA